MTAREKKAVELYRKAEPLFNEVHPDERILGFDWTQAILEAMQWQAEQCGREVHTSYKDYSIKNHNTTYTRIRNAGTEEVE